MKDSRIIRFVKFGAVEMIHCAHEDDFMALLESIKSTDGVTEYAVFSISEEKVKVARWE